MAEFSFTDLLPLSRDDTTYRKIADGGVVAKGPFGRSFLEVDPEALTLLSRTAFRDIAHLLRPSHLRQLRSILDDPEASPNDRYVARDLLQNANIAAGGVLPMCQDTGTAIVMGKRGQQVLTDGRDEEHLARGVYDAYTQLNLRYSQMAPLTMWDEKNTGSNLPAQIELYATDGDAYKFLFMAKGGGSANKSYLYQETKAVLNPTRMASFLEEKIRAIGTSACPPVPPGDRRRRDQRRVRAQDGQVRVRPVPGHAADRGLDARQRLPRRRARADGARHHQEDRDRRAVRRQVLLPRRAGDQAAPARGVLPGGDRGLLLGRPAGARQDHRRGRLPRGARDRPGAVPAGPGVGCRRRAPRSCRSTSAGRWRRFARSSPGTRSRRGSR